MRLAPYGPQACSSEWRELGFHYDRDDETRVWRLTGSRAGLLAFRDVLLSYVADPGKAANSEHLERRISSLTQATGFAVEAWRADAETLRSSLASFAASHSDIPLHPTS